jgi:osmoprotectant transport system ATP-binding protein
VIEFESVSKVYRDGTHAVEGLSLQIPSDQITVFVGPSGCGKTTTLRMINRMLEPTKGRITWDGAPLRSKRKTTLRRQMGYVIQSGGLFPHRTVLDNIGTVPALIGWDKTKTRKRSLELLDSVGLDRRMADRYPAQLSGGQQQRVGVARALAADPLVMLMDEPFSAVDPVVRGDLHELFLSLQRELSKTIVLITHDIDEAIKLGDQVAILRVGGKLAQVGTPQQLLDEPADQFVEGFVGRDRGYRALSFQSASGLSLDRVAVVRDPTSGSGDGPTLVVDGDAKPVGWVDRSRPGQVLGLGSIFDPETDTLRAALDSALTSPVGLAVAVHHDTGRYAGVVGAAAVLSQVTESRAAVADTISGRRHDDGPTPVVVAPAPEQPSALDSLFADDTQHADGHDDARAGNVPAAEVDTPTEIRPIPAEGVPTPEHAETDAPPTDTVHTEPEPEQAEPEHTEPEHADPEHAEPEPTDHTEHSGSADEAVVPTDDDLAREASEPGPDTPRDEPAHDEPAHDEPVERRV